MKKTNTTVKRAQKEAKKPASKAPRPKITRPGNGGVYPPENGKKFTKDYQPSGEAKSLGKWKKKKGQELARAILELAFQGMKNSELKKAAAEYYGVDPSEITVEMMLVFRQAEKAIQKADTPAFVAVMDRAHGRPAQRTEITGEGGKDLIPPTQMTPKQIQKLVDKL